MRAAPWMVCDPVRVWFVPVVPVWVVRAVPVWFVSVVPMCFGWVGRVCFGWAEQMGLLRTVSLVVEVVELTVKAFGLSVPERVQSSVVRCRPLVVRT